MSNLHWKDKLIKVSESVKYSNEVPEKYKNFGLGCFIGILLFVTVILLFVIYNLFQTGHSLMGFITLILVIGIGFIIYSLLKAESFP